MINFVKIEEALSICDDWNIYRQEKFIEWLNLSDEFSALIDASELRPLFDMNVIDFFNPKEPITSKMLEMVLSYHDCNGYVILKSFSEHFLIPLGFDIHQILEPNILSEKQGHIDIRISEPGKYAIIIENKLKGAEFQRNQIARYIQTLRKEGFENEQIYVIILPNLINININQSVWRLPPDYDANNGNRHCGLYEYSCWCDFPNRIKTKKEKHHCSSCITNWKEEFSPRSIILHKELSEWMIEVEELIPRRELNVRSALLQLADYLNGLYNNRTNQKLNMMITNFLRDKLQLDTSQKSWKKLNTQIEEVEELLEGLSTLRMELSSDLIDKWYDNLRPKWNMLRNEPRKSFGILINGMWFGCWWAEESDNGDSPIWGIYCEDGNPTSKQTKVAEKILSRCGINIPMQMYKGWLVWDNTIQGDKVADRLYNAASELGYLK